MPSSLGQQDRRYHTAPATCIFRKALEAIRGHLPKEVLENLEILTTIQAVTRTARNDAGHPVITAFSRQQVYVFVQLFVPMARQMMLLRRWLA